MSTRVQFHMSHEGMAEILRGAEMAAAVHEAAAAVAANLDGQDFTAHSGAEDSGPQLSAELEDTITDRARTDVVVKHPAAMAMQAKFGVFTKAAAAAGLEVHAVGGK